MCKLPHPYEVEHKDEKGDFMSMSIERFKFLFPKQAEVALKRQRQDKEMNNTAVKTKSVSKYHNVKTEYNGIVFDSKKEASVYAKLYALHTAGKIINIILQPEFELQEGYIKDGKKITRVKYKADFLVKYKNGRQEVIDVKGFKQDKVYLLKKKLFHYKFPNLTIIEI